MPVNTDLSKFFDKIGGLNQASQSSKVKNKLNQSDWTLGLLVI